MLPDFFLKCVIYEAFGYKWHSFSYFFTANLKVTEETGRFFFSFCSLNMKDCYHLHNLKRITEILLLKVIFFHEFEVKQVYWVPWTVQAGYRCLQPELCFAT